MNNLWQNKKERKIESPIRPRISSASTSRTSGLTIWGAKSTTASTLIDRPFEDFFRCIDQRFLGTSKNPLTAWKGWGSKMSANRQLYLAVGLPVLAIITSLIVSLLQVSGMRAEIGGSALARPTHIQRLHYAGHGVRPATEDASNRYPRTP